MNPARRAIAMLVDPLAEWSKIGRESGDPAYLLSRYVAALALVPAVFGFIGVSVIGVIEPGAGLTRASLFDGVFGAIFGYVESFVAVLVLGFIVNILAPAFGAQRDFDAALKLVVYSYTPAWLAGVFLVLPGLRFLVLTGLYGAYLVWTGLPLLMKSPAPSRLGYAAVIVICAGGLAFMAAAAQHAIFGWAAW